MIETPKNRKTELLRSDEPCMACMGTGWVSEPLEGGRTLHDRCDRCHGSGFKTVKLTWGA